MLQQAIPTVRSGSRNAVRSVLRMSLLPASIALRQTLRGSDRPRGCRTCCTGAFFREQSQCVCLFPVLNLQSLTKPRSGSVPSSLWRWRSPAII